MGRWLRDHSRLVQATTEGHHALKIRLASWRAGKTETPRPVVEQAGAQGPATQKEDQLSRADELGVDNLIYLEPGNAEWKEAWLVTEGLIALMRDEVRARGAQFVVVTLSNGIQVVPNPQVRETFEKRMGITDIFYPDNRIKSVATREGIPVITLAPELQKVAIANNVFLHGFDANIGNGHWNQAGHRAAGELLAKKFCEEVLSK
jgi:hypothetical protein